MRIKDSDGEEFVIRRTTTARDLDDPKSLRADKLPQHPKFSVIVIHFFIIHALRNPHFLSSVCFPGGLELRKIFYKFYSHHYDYIKKYENESN